MVKPVDPAQGIFDFGESPEQPKKRKPADPGYKEVHEKYNPTEKDPKAKAAENEEFKDKRQPKSELIRQAEIDKMKEILNKPKTGGGGGGGGMGTGKMNRDISKNMKTGGKVKKYESGGSIRVDRSPKYSNSQMASVREQLDKNEKAAKPEHDKNVERYNKATDEVTKRTQPGMAKMNPMGDTYKKGGKVSAASKRADGCCVKGKTKGRMV